MKRKLVRMQAFDWFNYIFIILLCAAFLYPMLLNVSISLSDGTKAGKIFFLPVAPNLDAYKMLLKDPNIPRYYFNSVFYSLCGTLLQLTITSLTAFPFIVPDFRGKRFFNLYMVITMFFGGGLIPYYYVIRGLRMIDTVWVMLIPGCVAAYNVIIFQTFFSQLPGELRESAHMDGAGHYRILFQIIIPISKPLLATFALFGIVGRWNDWFTPVIFMRREILMPMQVLLRKMLISFTYKAGEAVDFERVRSLATTRTMKCAAVMVTIFPILCVYPFLQKYFAKGVMIGALKM